MITVIVAYPGAGSNYISSFYNNIKFKNDDTNEYIVRDRTTRHFQHYTNKVKTYTDVEKIIVVDSSDISNDYFILLSLLKTDFLSKVNISNEGVVTLYDKIHSDPYDIQSKIKSEPIDMCDYERYKMVLNRFDVTDDNILSITYYFNVREPSEHSFTKFINEFFLKVYEPLQQQDMSLMNHFLDLYSDFNIEILNYKKLFIDNEPQTHYLDKFMKQHKEYHRKNIEFYSKYKHLIPTEYQIDINTIK